MNREETDALRERFVKGTMTLTALIRDAACDGKALRQAAKVQHWEELRAAYNRRQLRGETSVDLLRHLGDELSRCLAGLGGSQEAFDAQFCGVGDAPQADTKRLRDFIAAYHELARAVLDIQPEAVSPETRGGVVILPPADDPE